MKTAGVYELLGQPSYSGGKSIMNWTELNYGAYYMYER